MIGVALKNISDAWVIEVFLGGAERPHVPLHHISHRVAMEEVKRQAEEDGAKF